ncbi:hypothetical protein ACP70R_017551 [Stipagrostis hirtigluma subsp. patula]
MTSMDRPCSTTRIRYPDQSHHLMKGRNDSPLPSGFGTRPWLIQAHGTRKETQTFVDTFDRSLHEVIIPEMRGKICLGCVHDGGWLMMMDEATQDCFLLSVTDRRSKILLPPLLRLASSEYMGTCGALGSPATASFAVVIASTAESEQNFLLCCRPGDEEWTDLLAEDGGIRFSGGVVSHEGKLYVSIFCGDLVVVQLVDGAVQAQILRTEVEEEPPLYGSLARYLVVSCGDFFAVKVKYLGRPYAGAVNWIVVHRLDPSGNVWRRVESIGRDRAFLVSGDYGLSCAATAGQLEGNCVYIVWSSCDCERLYKFCLDDKSISFHQILPEPTTPCYRAYWAVPADCSVQATEFNQQALLSPPPSNEATTLPNDLDKDSEEQQGDSSPPWHDLPPELLELIASNLSLLVDRLSFLAVCKSWSKVSNPIQQAKAQPWLMHSSKQDGTCKILHPLRGTEYTLQVVSFKSDKERQIFQSSKDGWVVVSGGLEDDEICIINPFTQDIVEPPLFESFYRFCGVTFSSAPTSPDCIVFCICSSLSGAYISVETWRPGEDEWSVLRFEELEEPFPVAHNNPIYFRGEFYCLGRKGNLAVFNPSDNTWRVLHKPEPIYAELHVFDDDHDGAKFCYLVELEGELISVFMRSADEPPRVFKLDETKMAWTEVEDIGGAALFLDHRVSFGMVSPGAGNGNKIYFPRYSEEGKHSAFYDLGTKMYYPTFYGLKEPLNCLWVVPNLQIGEYAPSD